LGVEQLGDGRARHEPTTSDADRADLAALDRGAKRQSVDSKDGGGLSDAEGLDL
jgi:hypothetical protein